MRRGSVQRLLHERCFVAALCGSVWRGYGGVVGKVDLILFGFCMDIFVRVCETVEEILKEWCLIWSFILTYLLGVINVKRVTRIG